MQPSLKYILLLAVILILLFLGFKSYSSESAYIETTQKISSASDTSQTLQKRVDQYLEKFSLGFYDRYSQQQKESLALERHAASLHAVSLTYLYYFFFTLLLFMLLFYLIDFELFVIFIGTSALIALLYALFTPMLMVTVYKSFPLIGEVTLSYESKSIYTTITKLFAGKNYLLGMLILLFSLIIPLAKSLLIVTYGYLKETGFGKRTLMLIEKIGKWSMADVFIVALLVVIFSTKQDIHTSIRVENGVYFFVMYVLLSMLGSSLLPRGEKCP